MKAKIARRFLRRNHWKITKISLGIESASGSFKRMWKEAFHTLMREE